MKQTKIKSAIFEGKKIRRKWDERQEKWYFSVVDIVAVLTGRVNFQLARNYWKVLKHRLKKERNEAVTKCNRLKMLVANGNGLGLYLAKQIMESSGGSIGFSSESGHGTTFSVNIPLTGMKSKEGEKGLE